MSSSFRRYACLFAFLPAIWSEVSQAAVPAAPGYLARLQAANQTAQRSESCKAVAPFYWEIGNQQQKLAGASVGGDTYTATTEMPIASASKWIFGAYVVQLRSGQLSQEDIAALTMTSGYTNFGNTSCVRLLPGRRAAETVAECFASANRKGGHNSDFNQDALGKFYYNGGHFQKLATDIGLGQDNNAALAADIQTQLGSDIKLTYGSPQLAGGVNTSAASYAIFLRKILSRQLYIGDLLGSHAVCTNPDTCASALHTPVPEELSWNYSLGHWVEVDPDTGDGAFSSAGAFGFYPWIDASKTWYGILARKGQPGSGEDSARCGGQIRKAWVSGVAQL